MAFWVYIMANQRNGTTYIGHTDNLYVRTLQHRDETYGATPPNTAASSWSGPTSIRAARALSPASGA